MSASIQRGVPLDASGNVNVDVKAGASAGGTSSSFAAAFPGSGTAVGAQDAGGLMQSLNVDASGNLKTSSAAASSATATLSSVSASVTSVTLLSANSSRLAFKVYNDSTSPANLKLGATASATSFIVRLLPNQTWGTADLGVNYVGRIDAIWDSAAGAMRITELT